MKGGSSLIHERTVIRMDDIQYAVIDSPVYTYKVLVASHIEHGQIGEIQFYIRESSIHISWSEVVRHLREKAMGKYFIAALLITTIVNSLKFLLAVCSSMRRRRESLIP
jgi:hypothetical protein